MRSTIAIAGLLGAAACGADDQGNATAEGSSSSSDASTGEASEDGSQTDGESSTSDATGDGTGADGSTGDTDGEGSSDESSTGEPAELQMELIGRYTTDVFAEGAAEISAFDPGSERLFVVNGATDTIDVVDLSDPTTPTFVEAIAVADGGSPNSVAVHEGVVAVAVENADVQQPGAVEFFDVDGEPLAAVTVGALPDMLTFTPDGSKVVVANEGEPDDEYLDDPEGSVSIIDVSGELGELSDEDVITAGFGGFDLEDLDDSVRIFGPDASVAQDLEPEYVAVSPDGSTAWVTLQENNAVAVVDLDEGIVTAIVGLGFKDHSVRGQGLDPSDDDGEVAIATWPVFGVYMPDAIAAFSVRGETFLVTANEGDARDYAGFGEEERVLELTLDPEAFPDAAALQGTARLGRLRITETLGNTDDDADYEELYAFGTRSITVWDGSGALVWDSGDLLEQTVAVALPTGFNSNNDANDSFDGRSDDKGPEPEGVVVAEVLGSTYAFVGLERVGGVAVFDLADPRAPGLVTYVNDRDFDGDPEAHTAGDLGPEGLTVVAAQDSPTGNPLVVVSYEVSGSVGIYELTLR